MWNKLLLLLFIGSLTFSLAAQQYRGSRRSRGRQTTTSVQQNKTEKKTSSQQKNRTSERKSTANGKFDPKKPVLTQNYIDSVMDGQIRKKLLECKVPAKLPGSKDDDEENAEDGENAESSEKPEKTVFISRLDFSILISQYKSLMSDFELTEVSHIPLEWYQKFDTELRKFGSIVNQMTIAVRTRSNGRYAAAVQKFKDHQKACLKFLKEKPPKISKEEYSALVLKNTKIRQQNYLKRLREEREAAIKRRQEQLKQQNQPKNPGNKKTASGVEAK